MEGNRQAQEIARQEEQRVRNQNYLLVFALLFNLHLQRLARPRSGVISAAFNSGSEARDVALEAARKVGKLKKGRKRAEEREEDHFVADEEVIGLEEEVDTLPEGMDWKDLPRFEKIHGWDKESRDLK